MKGCGGIVELVYDSKGLNELGFVKEELTLRDWVSKDTERHLFEKLGKGNPGRGRPQDYKDEMLEIMEAFMEQVTKQEERESAIQCYEHTKNIGNDTIFECSPGKTQNHGVPPPHVRQRI